LEFSGISAYGVAVRFCARICARLTAFLPYQSECPLNHELAEFTLEKRRWLDMRRKAKTLILIPLRLPFRHIGLVDFNTTSFVFIDDNEQIKRFQSSHQRRQLFVHRFCTLMKVFEST
jgi:hypothetical protein